MKKISFLWITLIILLFSFLLIIGIKSTNKKKPYKEFENDIVEAMKVYYGQDENLGKLPKGKEQVKVSINTLKDFGLSLQINKKDEKCLGYGIVEKSGLSFKYKAFIKCNDYITKGY